MLTTMESDRWRWLVLRPLFTNPYYYTGAVVARVSVNLATLIWSLLVLLQRNALLITPRSRAAFAPLTAIMDEDLWAIGALAFCTLGIVRLWVHAKPSIYGFFGYMAQCLFWTFACYSSWFLVGPPFPPTTTATITVVAILSVYAFVTNPKAKRGDA